MKVTKAAEIASIVAYHTSFISWIGTQLIIEGIPSLQILE